MFSGVFSDLLLLKKASFIGSIFTQTAFTRPQAFKIHHQPLDSAWNRCPMPTMSSHTKLFFFSFFALSETLNIYAFFILDFFLSFYNLSRRLLRAHLWRNMGAHKKENWGRNPEPPCQSVSQTIVFNGRCDWSAFAEGTYYSRLFLWGWYKRKM